MTLLTTTTTTGKHNPTTPANWCSSNAWHQGDEQEKGGDGPEAVYRGETTNFRLCQVVGSALCGDGVGGSKVQHGGFSKMQ